MRARSFRSPISLIIASAFAVGSILVGVTPATAAPTAPRIDDQPPSLTSADPASDGSTLAAATESAASAEAVSTGKMVNVAADTSEDSITWANPDGGFTTQETGGPTRVSDSSTASGWRDIDNTLVQNSDGSISPKSPYLPVKLSGAATATQVAQNGLVSISDGAGSNLKFGWGGALPEPTLDGDVATYTGVEPNMNLVLTMTASGFEENYVLTAAPTRSELNLVLPLSTPGLTAQTVAGGAVNFVNSAADAVGTLSPGLMWDSRVDPDSGMPTDEVPISTSVSSGTMDVTSPASFFADPNIQYPVTIDPSYNQYDNFDTYIRSDFPTTKYSSYDPTELEVGTYNGGASVARTFLNFPSSQSGKSWLRKVIKTAELTLYEFHAYNCTAGAIYAQRSDPASASTDWNSPPSGRTTSGESDTVVAKGGGTACPAGNIGINVLNQITYDAAHSSSSTIGLALVAGSESVDTDWKRLNSADDSTGKPTLAITWYSQAATPPNPTFSSPVRSCGADNAPVFINNAQDDTLTSTVSDDDGVALTDTANVYVATNSGGTWSVPPGELPTFTTTPLGTATSGPYGMDLPLGTLPEGTYAVNVQTQYTTYAPADSLWSGYCYFTVDNTSPTVPTITPVGAEATSVGQDMTVTFSASSTTPHITFAYWWLWNSSTSQPTVPVSGATLGAGGQSLPADNTGAGIVRFATVSTTGGNATTSDITIDPPAPTATLWVVAYDDAGNISEGTPSSVVANDLQLGVPPHALSDDPRISYAYGHEWILDSGASSPLPTTLSDSGATASSLSLGPDSPNNVEDDLVNAGSSSPVLSFANNAGDTVSSSAALVDTTKALTVSAFVMPTSTTSGAETAISQEATVTGNVWFALGLSAGGYYEFCVNTIEAVPNPPSGACAVAAGAAIANSPIFLEGVWDASNQQVELLESGSATPIATAWYTPPTTSTPTAATGPLLIGEDYSGLTDSNMWSGEVTDPSIFPGVIDDNQTSELFYPKPLT